MSFFVLFSWLCRSVFCAAQTGQVQRFEKLAEDHFLLLRSNFVEKTGQALSMPMKQMLVEVDNLLKTRALGDESIHEIQTIVEEDVLKSLVTQAKVAEGELSDYVSALRNVTIDMKEVNRSVTEMWALTNDTLTHCVRAAELAEVTATKLSRLNMLQTLLFPPHRCSTEALSQMPDEPYMADMDHCEGWFFNKSKEFQFLLDDYILAKETSDKWESTCLVMKNDFPAKFCESFHSLVGTCHAYKDEFTQAEENFDALEKNTRKNDQSRRKEYEAVQIIVCMLQLLRDGSKSSDEIAGERTRCSNVEVDYSPIRIDYPDKPSQKACSAETRAEKVHESVVSIHSGKNVADIIPDTTAMELCAKDSDVAGNS